VEHKPKSKADDSGQFGRGEVAPIGSVFS